MSIRVDLKTRIVEGSNPGAAQFGRAGNEDATLVGGAGGGMIVLPIDILICF